LISKGSAAKRHRQSEKRRIRNRAVRSRVRTTTKKFLDAVDAGDEAEATNQFTLVIKLLDSAAGKGVFHKNTASRSKSRLHKRLSSLQAK
jgi:small subunit ribosomal protein S20